MLTQRQLDYSDSVSRPEPSRRQRIRLLSYNIQVGIASTRFRDYFTMSWKHVLPHAQLYENLQSIARIIGGYDLVALQEADGGSLRSGFINQTEYLAHHAEFPFWSHQVNRDLGRFAQHANGLLSRYKPSEVIDFKLPGFIPGRGALMVRFGSERNPLVVVILHLALGQRARQRQLASIGEIVRNHEHVVVMGDMNCQPNSPEMRDLLRKTHLCEPAHGLKTFPSWRPARTIDHILVTPSLEVRDVHVLNHLFSDHLPIAMDITLPKDVTL
jgi:endonuclease/exonuclease/phosphatase family metal-dependent hydrolase